MDRSRWSLGAAKSDRLLGPAAGVSSMVRSRWSLGAAKSDRLLGPAAGVSSMVRSRWSLRAATSDTLLDISIGLRTAGYEPPAADGAVCSAGQPRTMETADAPT